MGKRLASETQVMTYGMTLRKNRKDEYYGADR